MGFEKRPQLAERLASMADGRLPVPGFGERASVWRVEEDRVETEPAVSFGLW